MTGNTSVGNTAEARVQGHPRTYRHLVRAPPFPILVSEDGIIVPDHHEKAAATGGGFEIVNPQRASQSFGSPLCSVRRGKKDAAVSYRREDFFVINTPAVGDAIKTKPGNPLGPSGTLKRFSHTRRSFLRIPSVVYHGPRQGRVQTPYTCSKTLTEPPASSPALLPPVPGFAVPAGWTRAPVPPTRRGYAGDPGQPRRARTPSRTQRWMGAKRYPPDCFP